MSSLSMDVSSGEMAGICDYSNEIDNRQAHDFFSELDSACMLCGPVDRGRSHAALRHSITGVHKKRVAQYSNCICSLLVHERCSLRASSTGVTRREIVLVYLADRLARADVIRGVGQYNSIAVNYLLGRSSTSDLLHSFTEIEAAEHRPTRGLCSICLERPSSMMFEECNHVCSCGMCVAKLRASAGDSDSISCPICRVSSAPVSVFIA